MYMSFSRIQVN